MNPGGHPHPHSARRSHPHGDDRPSGLPTLLDLDAQVLAASLADARADVRTLVEGRVRTILDLGAGTGSGTFGLLQCFPGAHALVLDQSDDMLQHVRDRARHLGVSSRVSTLRADLDQGLPDLPPVDVAWASGSLHHLAEPDVTLADIASVIRPGGLLAVIELTGHPRFLPDDTAGGVAESNAHALLAGDRAVDMPTMGGDWRSRLSRAGLAAETERTIEVDLAPPLPPVAGDYAFALLTRIRDAVAGRLGLVDDEQLGLLLDGGTADVRRRGDLHVRAERQLLIARR
ncbi:hypothetical protein NPS01_25010 [Nocardioides psychrotolerans]|uniref:Methyltransferase domain-containing protein n=1 Tax=Nocardioides psychrotolerans TaxID=1005945 RepID=A0A1I3LJY8_9ACTN|nr:class I SAM-dependent methyltransferase [Nocardioides psychrotolerans]GEP38838.1 hypothetical protein NPS01_25010 [Nocardioides psychrotolerans]SFI85042.1 Methyltransferase domain-containing protein [Nocardioides psychrotolerans]